MKLRMKCRHCGSEEVFLDAYAEWDFDLQYWKLSNVYEEAWCNQCEGETKIVEEDEE